MCAVAEPLRLHPAPDVVDGGGAEPGDVDGVEHHGGMVFPAKRLAELGFRVLATEGTAATLRLAGVHAEVVGKFSEGGPSVVDELVAGRVDLVLNTPMGSGPRVDGYEIRTAAVTHGVPCVTTLPGILAAIQGIEALRGGSPAVRSLQSYHAGRVGRPGAPAGSGPHP